MRLCVQPYIIILGTTDLKIKKKNHPKPACLCFSTSTLDAFSCGYLKHLGNLSTTQKPLFLQQKLH